MSVNRSASVWLALSPSKYMGLNVSMTKRKPSLASNEIAMEMRLEIPDALFKKPTLSASLVATGDVPSVTISPEVIADIQQHIERSTGLVVELVQKESSDE